jgi:hypothetical protein
MPRWPATYVPVTIKRCKQCGVEKSPPEFYDCKRCRDGKSPRCRSCVLQRIAERRSDPTFLKAEQRRGAARYTSVKGRAQHLLHRARNSPDGCTLTLDDVIRGIELGHCPITGIQFDLSNEHLQLSGRTRNPYGPSLDRINPRVGYTPENTRVVIWQYNAMKGEISDDEVLFICQQIAARAA